MRYIIKGKAKDKEIISHDGIVIKSGVSLYQKRRAVGKSIGTVLREIERMGLKWVVKD